MNIFKRFGVAGAMILDNLDDQSLVRSKAASKEIAEFLENEKFYWMRIIIKNKDKFQGYEESWKEVINKIPVNRIKELGISVLEHVEDVGKVSSLHVGAKNGSLDLYQYIITKIGKKIPPMIGEQLLFTWQPNMVIWMSAG